MSVRLMALTAYCIPVSLCVATRTVENVPVPVPPSTRVRAYLTVAAEGLLGSLLWHAHVASLSWHVLMSKPCHSSSWGHGVRKQTRTQESPRTPVSPKSTSYSELSFTLRFAMIAAYLYRF